MNEISGRIFVITGGASLTGSHLTNALLAGGAAEVRLVENFALGSPDQIAHLTGNPKVGAERRSQRWHVQPVGLRF